MAVFGMDTAVVLVAYQNRVLIIGFQKYKEIKIEIIVERQNSLI
jgi:hypothetical protein